jgi:hypothetical protein
MQASAVVVILLGREDPDEIIHAILGFIITQHNITRVEVERLPNIIQPPGSSSEHWKILGFGFQI